MYIKVSSIICRYLAWGQNIGSKHSYIILHMTNIICKSCVFKVRITVTKKSVSVQGPELHVSAEIDLGSVTYRQEVVGRLSVWAVGSKFPGG